jgi:probable HAF family extracellular repeat protein
VIRTERLRSEAALKSHPFAWSVPALAFAAGACTLGCGKSSSSTASPPATTGFQLGDASTLSARDLGAGRCVGVNGHGQVVGVDVDDTTFVVAADGTRTTLPPPDGNTTVTGIAIDDGGRVAGYATGSTGRYAVIFQNGGWTPIPNLGAGSQVLTAAADGAVGGASFSSDGTLRGFLIAGGQPAAFDWPDGGSAVYATATGARVAGIVETPSGSTHAFVSAGRALNDLGTLGGAKSAAHGMNARGDVVGVSETKSSASHAFLVPAGSTTMVDLGLPQGAAASDAQGIDGSGNVLGNSVAADGSSRAWLFRVGKSPVELVAADASNVSYLSVHGAAISADGMAVGWGVPQPSDAGMTVRCLAWPVVGM